MLTDIQKKNICLRYIEDMLLCNNRSLKIIPNMTLPDEMFTIANYNRLVSSELNYNINELHEQHQTMYASLTNEQKDIYHLLMNVFNIEK